MAATVTVSTTGREYTQHTITLAGHAATTTYVVYIQHGFGTQTKQVTTDGSGNATVTWVPNHAEKVTISTRPLAETNGTTPAAATTTAQTAR